MTRPTQRGAVRLRFAEFPATQEERMHVLVFEGWPTLMAGGQERSLFEVVSGLRARGIDVTLAYEQHGELVERYRAIGVETYRIPTRNVTVKSRHALRNIARFITAIGRVLSRHRKGGRRIDLIYVNQYFDTPLAALCGRMLGVPVICHLRLPAPEYLSRQYRWGLQRCARLIANSQFTAGSFEAAGFSEDRVTVIHNAIDVDLFSPSSDAELQRLAERDYRVVLYVGRVTPDKGIDTLIDAVAIARRTDPRIRLRVVGNVRGAHSATPAYLAELRARATDSLGDAVEFRPATPDVVPLYRDADLVVLPSRWEEPFGRVLIEAMACGVPAIGTRVGGIPEVLTGQMTALLIERDDTRTLMARICETIEWRKMDPGFGLRCRTHSVSNFNSDEMLTRLAAVLLAIASRQETFGT